MAGTGYMISVSPNPTSGLININCEKVDAGDFNLQLFTISGEKVFQKNYVGTKIVSLNLESYLKAPYILVVRTKNNIYTGKIIVN